LQEYLKILQVTYTCHWHTPVTGNRTYDNKASTKHFHRLTNCGLHQIIAMVYIAKPIHQLAGPGQLSLEWRASSGRCTRCILNLPPLHPVSPASPHLVPLLIPPSPPSLPFSPLPVPADAVDIRRQCARDMCQPRCKPAAATGGPEPALVLGHRNPTPAPHTRGAGATAATGGGPEPSPLLARGPVVAAPGGWEIKTCLGPLMCRTCKSRSDQAACRDEPDQPRAASDIQQEKYPDING
jgi:hypothetical protein